MCEIKMKYVVVKMESWHMYQKKVKARNDTIQ